MGLNENNTMKPKYVINKNFPYYEENEHVRLNKHAMPNYKLSSIEKQYSFLIPFIKKGNGIRITL